jgi:hypothetical protein
MKFAALLSFQKPPQSLEELHAKVTAIAALTPRSRTDFLEECEAEAKELISWQNQTSNEYLCDSYNICVNSIATLRSTSCIDILNVQGIYENILISKKNNDLQQQVNSKNDALFNFAEATKLSDVLAPLQSATQYDSLAEALATRPKTALPLRFRILSRANESYGANNWTTKLSNTAANFYDLLMGTAADEYHSDFEPTQTPFLQGAAGNFVCNKMFAELYGYNGATSTAPMAAVGAFALENTTNEDQSRSIKFGLSSYNFAAVFLKAQLLGVDDWTHLFQTTSNLNHTSVMTADFVVPANQTATILLVSTPYYYRYYSGSAYNSHVVQFLQWNLFNVREMLGNELAWVF